MKKNRLHKNERKPSSFFKSQSAATRPGSRGLAEKINEGDEKNKESALFQTESPKKLSAVNIVSETGNEVSSVPVTDKADDNIKTTQESGNLKEEEILTTEGVKEKSKKKGTLFVLMCVAFLAAAGFLFLYPAFYFSYEGKTEQDGMPIVFQETQEISVDSISDNMNNEEKNIFLSGNNNQNPLSETGDENIITPKTENNEEILPFQQTETGISSAAENSAALTVLTDEPELSTQKQGIAPAKIPFQENSFSQIFAETTTNEILEENGEKEEISSSFDMKKTTVSEAERNTDEAEIGLEEKEEWQVLQQNYASLSREILLLKEQMRGLSSYKQKNVASLFSLLLMKEALEEGKEYQVPLQMFYAVNQDNPIAQALYTVLSQNTFLTYDELMKEYKEVYEIEAVSAFVSPQDSFLFRKIKQMFFSAVQVRKIGHFSEEDDSAFAVLNKAYLLLEEKKLQEATRLLAPHEGLFGAKMKTFLKNAETHLITQTYIDALMKENISSLLPAEQK